MFRRCFLLGLGLGLVMLAADVSQAQTSSGTQYLDPTQGGMTGLDTPLAGVERAGSSSGTGQPALPTRQIDFGLATGAVQQFGPFGGQTTAANTQNPMSQLGGMGGLGRMGGMMGPMGMGGMYGQMMYNTLSRQRRPLRVPISLGIDPPATFSGVTPPAQIGQRAQVRLTKIPQLRANGSVKVEMEGEIAVLRGEVKTKHDADLMTRVLLLEPGIADVRNELTVAPPKAAP
jgi:hypothetical protein